MRFDLEIPSTYVDLTYIPEGNKIPSGAVPLYYMDINHRSNVPADFLTVNENVVEDPTSELVFETHSGPSFGIRGNRFFVTNIAKYSVTDNIRIPLFHKMVIPDSVSEFSVKIIDHLGIAIDRKEYIVEEGRAETSIYMNDQSKILFIEYVSNNRSFKKLVSLEPVFTEVTWGDIVTSADQVPKSKYMLSSDGTLQTTHNETLYVKYVHDIHILQKPVANIEDSWYLGINNTSFSVVDSEDSGITYKYEVPEFYIQNPLSQSRFQEVIDKKCKVVFDDFVQTQSIPAIEALDKMRIYVRDYYTGDLKYAFTTNQELVGSKYENVYFSLAKDWNNQGVIQLPIDLTSSDVVNATYKVRNEYYKFRFLNLNSVEVGKDHYFSIYMKPNPMETELGVFFAIIGKSDTSDSTAIWKQGRAFGTVEEYDQFILDYNCYHVATIGINTSEEHSITRFTDVRKDGGELVNKELAASLTPDVFYKDIMDGNISFPTNDILIAAVSADSLLSQKIIDINRTNLETDEYAKKMLENVANVIDQNLDATTQSVLEIDISGNRLPK